ncbi:carbon-nitrogen family hydrolase, partial [bacterium]|nr:carbon-nitrogen family hydrolase [bacterium]
MRVFGIQLDMVWENKSANYERVRSLLDCEDIPANSLIALPEMFATGFSMNLADIHEPANGPTKRYLSDVAQTLDSFCIGGCVGMGDDGKGRNQALCFAPSGNEVARYTKMHPFTFGGETKHYTPGDQILTFQWGKFTVAPFICYDLRFPEMFRTYALNGVELVFLPAQWPHPRLAHWRTLLRARAIENQMFMIGVNSVGRDQMSKFCGHSALIDPWGNTVVEAGETELILTA